MRRTMPSMGLTVNFFLLVVIIGCGKRSSGYVDITGLTKRAQVGELISFTVLNKTDAPLWFATAVERLEEGKVIGEVPDIGMKSYGKERWAFTKIPAGESVDKVWDPKQTPKEWYNGTKGEFRFRLNLKTELRPYDYEITNVAYSDNFVIY